MSYFVLVHPRLTNSTVVQQIRNWFNNRCRGIDSAKMGRGDLKLDTNEKRKLAPLQAYCSYAWTTLQPIVLTRWQQSKASATFDDVEDPSEDAEGTSAEACIPLSFKLKIAKEIFDELSAAEKAEIDTRREEDRKKLYLSIPELTDERDRTAKLEIHQRYCSLTDLRRIYLTFSDSPGTRRWSLNHCSAFSKTWKTKQGASPSCSSVR